MGNKHSLAGHGHLTPEIVEWLCELHAPETWPRHAALARLGDGPEPAEGLPAIQISPLEGRLLALLCRLTGVRRAVEFGTLSGYSALWLLEGMPADGYLWTVEHDPAHAAVAREVFARAENTERVIIVESDGVTALPALAREAPFDLVFLDADKESYGRYAEWAVEHLRPGGLLVADNALLFGELLDDIDAPSGTNLRAEGMRTFHRVMAERFDATVLLTPDGLGLGVRR